MHIPIFSDLCMPARIYLLMMLTSIVVWVLYYMGYITYQVPENIPGVVMLLFTYMFYVLFFVDWTWFLHVICNSGNSTAAWFFVMIPVFLILSLLMLSVVGSPYISTGAMVVSTYFGGNGYNNTRYLEPKPVVGCVGNTCYA